MSSTENLATAASVSDTRRRTASRAPARTRIKLCGLSNPATNVNHAIELGADAIGLVFYPPSPRSVSVAQAVEIMQDVPPFVSVVGLFVNPSPEWVREVVSNVGLSLLQFHGDETAEQCESLAGIAGLPWLRALRVAADTRPADLVNRLSTIQAPMAFCSPTLTSKAMAAAGRFSIGHLFQQSSRVGPF